MRATISGLVIAVTLALLSWPGLVLGQDQAEDCLASPVTGQLTDLVIGRAAPKADKEDLGNLVRYRDLSSEYTYEWSDPRLPGNVRLTWNWDADRVPGTAEWAEIEWGMATLTGDTGSWEGTFRGSLGTDGLWDRQFWLEGRGAYDGLCAVLNANHQGYGAPAMTGLVFEGEMPPAS